MDNNDQNLQQLFESIGLPPATVKGALKSTKFKNVLHELIAEADALENGCSKEKGNLLYTVAGKWNLPESAIAHRQVLVDCIMDGRIKTNPQVAAALEFLKKNNNHEFSLPDFNKLQNHRTKTIKKSTKKIKREACIKAPKKFKRLQRVN
eukprot:TRINITY_DN14249_c0_g2_i1.p1 TRINITY_DN14249_c0_g2~~TRINITY_DN14249_c0_g2_i1.p1  ORF type:complete len:150 (-),score=24.12 TRINITY_DN14249_c0_g2_i1:307-756(-)